MNLILNNPYRTIGILADASTKEIQARKGKITAYAKVGKELSSEYDFSFFQPVSRNEEIINKAFSAIEQNTDKVHYALFWFISNNPIDQTAIQHLINGDKEKAIEIWRKLTDGKEINSKNFSAFNNIGTLYLLGQSNEEIKQGIEAKIKLIASDNFKDFVGLVADETFKIDQNKQIEILIDTVLAQFKNKFSTSETMDLFENCNETTQKYLSQKFTEEPIHKIESQTESTKNKRTKDKSKACQFGLDLYKNTKNELEFLKSTLGTENLQYKMLSDNVAKEMLQCSIDYFNESQKNNSSENYLEKTTDLARLAERIASNKITKDRIKDNISTLEEMKGREISNAIQFLKSVKEAYEKTYAEIEGIVKKQDPFGTRNINYSEIKKIAKKSINEDIVLDLAKEVLSEQAIIKIANHEKSNKITEFYNLLKDVDENIISLGLKKIEEILYENLPTTNKIYKDIYRKKEAEKEWEVKTKEREKEREKESNKLVELGDKAFKSKKWKKAIEYYEKALKINSYNNNLKRQLKIAEEAKEERGDKIFKFTVIGITLSIPIIIYLLWGWSGFLWVLGIVIYFAILMKFGKR